MAGLTARVFAYGVLLSSSVSLGQAAGSDCTSAGAPCAPTYAPSQSCGYLALKVGPAFKLGDGNRVSIDQAQQHLAMTFGGVASVVDLNERGPVEVKELSRFPQMPKSTDRAAGGGDSGRKRPLNDFKPVPLEPQTLRLPNGRDLTITRIYAANSVLKVGANDPALYEAFGQELLRGRYCGDPIATLPRAIKLTLKPLVSYFLFDAISAGRLDDFASWQSYSGIFSAFLTIDEIEEFLEIYGYRSSEQGRTIPELLPMDPNKVWTFAWNAAAKLFHDKDFTEFSDISAFQRDGKLTFTLLGSRPILGGRGNKFGFFTKNVAEVDARSVTGPTRLSWDWTQGDLAYAGTATFEPAAPEAQQKPRRFPGEARNGLLLLDFTLDRSDVADLLGAYVPYFEALGFRFGGRTPIADVPAFVKRTLERRKLDFVVKDGHSDGDDENVMVLYPTGFLLEGRRGDNGRKDAIEIVFNLDKNPPQRRIAYSAFAGALDRHFAERGRPLVYVDGSCWGYEKAWFGLGVIRPSELIEISSSSPVNFFENVADNAMHAVVQGILEGEGFDALRARLADLGPFASGREDQFIFPDDTRYPRSGALLKVELRLSRRRPGGALKPYTPDGYI